MNEIVKQILIDGGFKSRKLLFSVFSTLILLAGWFVAGHWVSLQPMFSSFVGGVVGVAGLYLTGSVATKFVGVKAAGTADQAKKDPAEE